MFICTYNFSLPNYNSTFISAFLRKNFKLAGLRIYKCVYKYNQKNANLYP